MQILIKSYLLVMLFSFIVLPLIAQNSEETAAETAQSNTWKDKGYLNAYGVVNYYQFDWDTDPNKRNAFDAERLNIYLGYHFNNWIEFKSEIEFEHGGTGASMSFDVLEEFGEFEQEIETGGEINLEQINILFKIKPWLHVRAGKFRVYMGVASKMDDPTEYFTTHRSETENTIIPLGWYEHGIELSGKITKHWNYTLYLMNGLDASGFNSSAWIHDGYQTRFETVNANNLAIAGRLDYSFQKGHEMGVSFYQGNSAGNRPKHDTDIQANVSLFDLHYTIDQGPWRARAYALYGHLSNSEAISNLNRNLSNNLNVKRSPVGESAVGAYASLAYDVFIFLPKEKIKEQQLYVFGRYDYYDSMFSTQGEIYDNPRWARSSICGGINYYPHPQVVIKMQYNNRTLGTGEIENTFSTGIGFKI